MLLPATALGEAAAATAPGDYKALVCVFLYGGNDYGNTLVPVDATGHANYVSLRGGLAGSEADARSAFASAVMSPSA